MEANNSEKKIYKNLQYSVFNPYNHIFYSCIKFQDFILYKKDCDKGTKSSIKGTRVTQRTSPRSTSSAAARRPSPTRWE